MFHTTCSCAGQLYDPHDFCDIPMLRCFHFILSPPLPKKKRQTDERGPVSHGRIGRVDHQGWWTVVNRQRRILATRRAGSLLAAHDAQKWQCSLCDQRNFLHLHPSGPPRRTTRADLGVAQPIPSQSRSKSLSLVAQDPEASRAATVAGVPVFTLAELPAGLRT